jgi:hypothetical protein
MRDKTTARRHEEIMAAWGTGATAAKIAEQFGLARQSVLREVCEARAAGDPRAAYRRPQYANNWRGGARA